MQTCVCRKMKAQYVPLRKGTSLEKEKDQQLNPTSIGAERKGVRKTGSQDAEKF